MKNRYPYEAPTRLEYLTLKYGECCTRVTAGKILNKTAPTVSQMIRDGRLQTVCEGKKIDMQSIAAYMDDARREDRRARLTKQYGKPVKYFV